MDNLFDLTNPDEAQSVASVPEPVEPEAIAETPAATEPAAPPVEEIDTAPKAQVAKALPTKAAPYKREEPPPNPLLLDPYEWDKCTITVTYSLLPDSNVSVSVRNHKDDPIAKTFPVEEVPLPERIADVMATLQSIFHNSPINTTVVLLPKLADTPERPIIASVQVAQDTPVVQEGIESNLPFPAPIVAMLEELKALMPERALKNIEKNAKAKTATTVKPANKPTASKPTSSVSAPAANKNVRKDQMTLF